jgi:hypothetical protein
MKNNLRNNFAEKVLLKYLIEEKACLGESTNITDPSQYSFILGRRSEIFTVLNPKKLIRSLRTFFYFLNYIVDTKGNLCFITNIDEPFLSNKLIKACTVGGHHCLNQNVKLNNLFSRNKPKAIVALFLDSTRLNVLYSESAILEVPVICFTTQANNFFSTNLQVLGAFRTRAAKNLLISLINLSKKKKKNV